MNKEFFISFAKEVIDKVVKELDMESIFPFKEKPSGTREDFMASGIYQRDPNNIYFILDNEEYDKAQISLNIICGGNTYYMVFFEEFVFLYDARDNRKFRYCNKDCISNIAEAICEII